MYTIHFSDDFEGLIADLENWNDLAGGVPFRESSWLGPWWKWFGQDLSAYVLLARDPAGKLCGILPLYRREDSPMGRVLQFIGDGQACSDFASILAAPHEATEIAQAMGRFLVAAAVDSRDGWEAMNLDGVSEGDPSITALLVEMAGGGAAIHVHSRMSSWFRPCDADWQAHLASHGKSQRRKLRHWSRQLTTIPGIARHVVQAESELPAALDALIEMHQRRWNEAGEPGSFAEASFEAFVRESAVDFLARGRLYLSTLTHHSQTIAAELHFLGGDQRLYCYSSGFDTGSAKLEPGRLLHADTLMHLYRERLEGIDFLRGDEPYKPRTGAVPTRVLRIRVAAPTTINQLLHSAWLTRFEFKQWLRRQAGRPPVTVLNLPCYGSREK